MQKESEYLQHTGIEAFAKPSNNLFVLYKLQRKTAYKVGGGLGKGR